MLASYLGIHSNITQPTHKNKIDCIQPKHIEYGTGLAAFGLELRHL